MHNSTIYFTDGMDNAVFLFLSEDLKNCFYNLLKDLEDEFSISPELEQAEQKKCNAGDAQYTPKNSIRRLKNYYRKDKIYKRDYH